MNLSMRRPSLVLEKVCPAFKRAMDEFDRLSREGKEDAAAKAWTRATEIREAFDAGVEYARRAA